MALASTQPKYFAYIYECYKNDNPYAPSKLRAAGNFNKTKFIPGDLMEKIIQHINTYETINLKMTKKCKLLVIVKLEDISHFMEAYDKDYPQFEDSGLTITNSHKPFNVTKSLVDSFTEDIHLIEPLKAAADKCKSGPVRYNKFYRNVIMTIDSSNFDKHIFTDDPVGIMIFNIVNKPTNKPVFGEFIAPADPSFTEKDFAFLFNSILNTSYNRTHQWFNLPIRSTYPFKEDYLMTIRSKKAPTYRDVIHTQYSTEILNCDYSLVDFTVEHFYPLRIKYKMIMNTTVFNDFNTKMFMSPFMNIIRYCIDGHFCPAQILAYRDINPLDYRFSISEDNFIIRISKDFMKQFTTYRNYMHFEVIRLLFYPDDTIQGGKYNYYNEFKYNNFIGIYQYESFQNTRGSRKSP
mgnify:CR=1 FL=1